MKWVEPDLEWRTQEDAPEVLARLESEGELLAEWPAAPFEKHPTYCYRLGTDYWISQSGVGSACFTLDAPRLRAYAAPGSDPDWFRQVVTRSWLPAIYPLWGRQVLHTSAVARADTLDAVAFTGQTHAGKSTTAYGLARRPGWRLLTDDTLAFSTTPMAGPSGILLHPIFNEARLRPESAEYFGRAGQDWEPVVWPNGEPCLRGIYVLDGTDEGPAVADFTRLRVAEGLPRLLQQAYALSFKIPKYNQQLMKDYAQLAAAVPIYRLRYRQSFAVADTLFASLDAHITTEVIR